ncbi:DUF6890 family protein [Pseudomonas sp. HK3]
MLAKYLLLLQKWLPNEPETNRNFAKALYLENQYWQRMSLAVSKGINVFFE